MPLDSVRSKAQGKGLHDELRVAVPRPPIWAEGHQRPKFDLLAWLRVSGAIAGRDLIPEIDDAATRLDVLGHRVTSGALRVTARWAKRILPSHQTAGMAILALSRSFVTAGALLSPLETRTEPLAYPHLGRVDRPSALVRPLHPSQTEPTLHAIRSAIGSPPHLFVPPSRVTPPFTKPRWIESLFAHGLLGVLLLFAWPRGAVKAMMYHLNGGDLRDWS